MSITTLTYDIGARAVVHVGPAPNVTITLAYDDSRKDVRGDVTSHSYVDSCSGIDERIKAVYSNARAGAALEDLLVAKLLILFRNPPPVGQPLWWHVWRTVAEDQWFRSEQMTIARRLVRHQQLIDEMCQFSAIHIGSVFERCPSLGLVLDEFPSQFPRRARRIIRRDFITWLRLRSNERRRMASWPTGNIADVRTVESLSTNSKLQLRWLIYRSCIETS